MKKIICRNCLHEKLSSLFRKQKDNKSGFTNICKECYNMIYSYRLKKEVVKDDVVIDHQIGFFGDYMDELV